MLAALLLSVAPSLAAGPCDAQLAKVGSLAPEAVAPAFTALAACDAKAAETNYVRFLERATDADALVALVNAAIAADVWQPVWVSLGKISSYEARDEIAQRVGESCTSNEKVLPFLKGAYHGLKEVDFRQWDDAYAACASDALWTWVAETVSNPPAKAFDEKFGALLDIYVKHARAAALPALGAGAVKAAGNNGPYDTMLRKMGEAARPAMGGQPSADDQKKLSEALVDVARKVPADKAKGVAATLASAGAEDAAASLLGTVYADRAQSGGFLYGAVSVEAGTCSGKKTAIVHFATVTEPGKRWTILDDLEGPMTAFKPKLGKECTDVVSPWPVLHSPEPVKSAADAEAYAETVVQKYTTDGYAVKVQKEKGVTLP
jgi:hypothetical protein